MKMQSVGQIMGCAYCEFKCKWALGKRPYIELHDHLKTEHPQEWTEDDEKDYQEWLAS